MGGARARARQERGPARPPGSAAHLAAGLQAGDRSGPFPPRPPRPHPSGNRGSVTRPRVGRRPDLLRGPGERSGFSVLPPISD